MVVMELGDGVNGHVNLAHGGFVCTILDEISGVVNHQWDGKPTFTAYLNVTFKTPTPAPGVVLCRAWITKEDGRKRYTYASLEDGRGNVYATAESLFLVLKSAL
jgi:thioesterase superfamily protein 4